MSSNSRLSFTRDLMDGYAVRAIASSTNASPIVVTTSAAHGLATDDLITINGHATNTAANGTWYITVTGTTTFELTKNKKSGLISTGNGVGGATGCFAKSVGMANIQDYKSNVISIDTDGGGDAAFTLKIVGSIQETEPDMAQPKSPSNSYEFIYLNDLQDPAVNLTGDTGFAVATADDNRLFEVNINNLKWVGVLPTAGTAGEATVRLRRSDNS